MMYISTDYVFDGQGDKPWMPDCKDYKPLNVYGQTKLEGELAVSSILDKFFIVRIAWVFGLNGNKEHTQKQVADLLGISQSYISRLEKRIMARLRKELDRLTGCA